MTQIFKYLKLEGNLRIYYKSPKIIKLKTIKKKKLTSMYVNELISMYINELISMYINEPTSMYINEPSPMYIDEVNITLRCTSTDFHRFHIENLYFFS